MFCKVVTEKKKILFERNKRCEKLVSQEEHSRQKLIVFNSIMSETESFAFASNLSQITQQCACFRLLLYTDSGH